MKRSLPRATGNTTDREVARMPFLVKTAAGRVLAGNHTEKGARKTAHTINQGRAEQVTVVARGAR